MNVAADMVGELWHKRLCHMSQKGMQKLAEDNLIPEVKNVGISVSLDGISGPGKEGPARAG